MNPLESALTELKDLEHQRQELEVKIEAVKQSARILDAVYSAPAEMFKPLLADTFATHGITAAIRKIFDARPNERLSPTAVRDHLVAGGFDLSGRSNPMAAIHTVLKRLLAGGVVQAATSGNTTVYFVEQGTCKKFPK